MDKFWSRIKKVGDCWVWDGYIENHGYGRLSFRGNNKVLAHRAAWMLANGEIPKGLCVLHKCDNPPCVNPNHLFLGTIADNNRDRDRKGRRVIPDNRGEKSGNAKLTEKQAREILRRVKAGEKGKDLAKEFGVSKVIVSQIKHGHRWAHIHV